MQALVRVQARVRARRLQLTHDKLRNQVDEEEEGGGGGGLEAQKLKSPMKKYEMQSRDSRHQRQQSSDKMKDLPSRKHDAVMKRERALAYALAYQVSQVFFLSVTHYHHHYCLAFMLWKVSQLREILK